MTQFAVGPLSASIPGGPGARARAPQRNPSSLTSKTKSGGWPGHQTVRGPGTCPDRWKGSIRERSWWLAAPDLKPKKRCMGHVLTRISAPFRVPASQPGRPRLRASGAIFPMGPARSIMLDSLWLLGPNAKGLDHGHDPHRSQRISWIPDADKPLARREGRFREAGRGPATLPGQFDTHGRQISGFKGRNPHMADASDEPRSVSSGFFLARRLRFESGICPVSCATSTSALPFTSLRTAIGWHGRESHTSGRPYGHCGGRKRKHGRARRRTPSGQAHSPPIADCTYRFFPLSSCYSRKRKPLDGRTGRIGPLFLHRVVVNDPPALTRSPMGQGTRRSPR